MLQVDSLTERVEELKQDKKRLVEEYEAKLSKVQYCNYYRGHYQALITFMQWPKQGMFYQVHTFMYKLNKCMMVESVLYSIR